MSEEEPKVTEISEQDKLIADKPQKKSRKQKRIEKKAQDMGERQLILHRTQNAKNSDALPSEQPEISYFTKGVVEKFLDIFGNRLGEPQPKPGKCYQTQGWGQSDDFVAVLRSAGWLINQREVADGRIINEKHSSSTISFQMPSIPGVKLIYFKFHGDHESGLTMREIARHFIIKALENSGYPEAFWLEYYQKYYS